MSEEIKKILNYFRKYMSITDSTCFENFKKKNTESFED